MSSRHSPVAMAGSLGGLVVESCRILCENWRHCQHRTVYCPWQSVHCVLPRCRLSWWPPLKLKGLTRASSHALLRSPEYEKLVFTKTFSGKVQYIVSQNIDGLHLRSGVPRRNLAELHGNMFVEQCSQCNRQFVLSRATSSVGQKCLLKPCPTSRLNGRPCRGRMHDTILDWEANLPENDLGMADFHSCVADLSICLGTTLQIVPSGNLPTHTKKYNKGRLVICNLQPTKHDRKADILIHAYVDDIMIKLMEILGLSIPDYCRLEDPIMSRRPVEWTILDSEVQAMRRIYEKTCCKSKKKPDKGKSSIKKIRRYECEQVDTNFTSVKKIKTEIKTEKEENEIGETG